MMRDARRVTPAAARFAWDPRARWGQPQAGRRTGNATGNPAPWVIIGPGGDPP